MSFAASSPLPSTSSSSPKDSESSPNMATNDTDLGLDPSDPLNLWLHNTSQSNDSSMDDDSAGESPPDWSQFSSLWAPSMEPGGNTKLDFGLGLDAEMDFVNSMAIDPNALHLNYQEFPTNDPTYPFTFQSNELLNSSEHLTPAHRERKLSITSSSSSSGASFSSISSPEAPSQVVAHLQDNYVDPAAELVQRVLQSAGLTLAVPAGAQSATNGASANSASPTSSPTTAYTSPSQLGHMPMHAYSPQSSASSTSSAPSTPPPSTPPQTSMALDPAMSMKHIQQAQGSSMGVINRPKTSHTTIERRYRTNLNARITSLRMAIPALRVLEDKDACNVGGGGKKGKNSTLGKAVVYGTKVKKENEDGSDVVDVIDERGFVDGVKVARKCSKANILGKAVEYIRVLKKREMRMKREQDGLKQLVRGLVGGPALLEEWEREWRAKFGGPERDEVEGDEDDGGSDDEGSGDDDDDDDGGRKRKKPKLAPPPKKEVKEKKPPPPQPQPQVLPDGTIIMPEKRKRGRPRKVQPNAPAPGGQTLTFPAMAQQPPVQQQPYAQQTAQPQQSQYLLAVFALFSFFNSPFSSSSHASPNHSHTGTVLTHDTAPVHYVAPGWTLHEVIQVFHLLVSALVFCSIVLPWLPSTKYFSLSYLSSLRTSYQEHRRTRSNSRTTETRSTLLRAALAKRGSADEAATLHDALRGDFSLTSLFGFAKKENNSSYQQKGLEQSAWVRLGELCVLEGETSIFNRALTFWHMRSHLSWFTCSAADLSTLALVLYPLCTLARRPAKALWEAARARKGYTGDQGRGVGVLIRPHERLVLETMEVDEAFATLRSLQRTSTVSTRYSPIGLLASMVIKERSKKHLQKAFVRTISPPSEKSLELEDDGEDVAKTVKAEEEEETEVRTTVDAARSLGGEVADIGEMLESLWNIGVHELDWDLEDDLDDGLDGEIRALATAIVLYRRIFSSSIMGPVGDGNGSAVSILLSPPPSPSLRDSRLHLTLRKALGSPVFEYGEGEDFGRALEDARDRVVDMLVECERACR
ncbi:hypothetical protein AAF712_002801 [Marasmius tenuissimus]|uniref:BHLH domain-containing protein n=1 Tax=Marasmius tenuissimus TaxID=585030 RepID=A0ABR3AAE1_9AGAR